MKHGFPVAYVPYFLDTDGCPFSVHSVQVEGSDDSVLEGEVGTQTRKVKIQEGILRLLDRATLSKVEAVEVTARDQEASRYNTRLAERHYHEVTPCIEILQPTHSDIILDAGCGTGRITKTLVETGARVIGVDFSFDSLREARQHVPLNGTVAFVEADITRLTMQPEQCTKVVSTQVLEHITTVEKRNVFAQFIRNVLKPGGMGIITAYHHDVRRRIVGYSREVSHKNGVYAHYFTRNEFSKLFTPYFNHIQFRYFDIVIPGLVRLGTPEKILGVISRIAENTPARELAHLIGAFVRKEN